MPPGCGRTGLTAASWLTISPAFPPGCCWSSPPRASGRLLSSRSGVRVRAKDSAFAWVSLDPDDNDPAQLWWHVFSALQRACPAFNPARVLEAFRPRSPDFAGAVLPLLLNELASLPEPVVLVLDDYHVISDRGCRDQVAFALQHVPPTVQLVLVTRADPGLPLARLRATGDMTEIRAQELRFQPAQVAELVAAVADVELAPRDLAVLAGRTEGWPAGVYLAALSLRGHPSPATFIRQFTGDSRFVVDFLAEEVLGAAGRSSPVPHPDLDSQPILVPVCDAVVGSGDAAAVVRLLERDNLFVVPLDDTRQWFRYHHLFAQVLRSELARAEPGIQPALHRRASAWFLQAGLADQAISHAFAAGDTAGVIRLIAWHWYAYVASGQMATVRRWLRSLGDQAVSADPVAAHCAAWTAALSGDREELRRWLPVVQAAGLAGPLPDGVHSMRWPAALLQATFGFDGLGPMRDAAAEAVRLEPDQASPWHALARAAHATALYWCGERAGAAEQAQAALRSPSSIGLIRMLALATLSLTAADDGELGRAEQLAHSAHEVLADAGPGFREAPQGALVHAATGAAAAQRGRLSEARRHFEARWNCAAGSPGSARGPRWRSCSGWRR